MLIQCSVSEFYFTLGGEGNSRNLGSAFLPNSGYNFKFLSSQGGDGGAFVGKPLSFLHLAAGKPFGRAHTLDPGDGGADFGSIQVLRPPLLPVHIHWKVCQDERQGFAVQGLPRLRQERRDRLRFRDGRGSVEDPFDEEDMLCRPQ